jgi:ceramide glucosyltransferase
MMPHALAQAVEIATTALAVAGMGYFLASLVAAQVFLHERQTRRAEFAPGVTADRSSSAGWRPGVSILKSLKGLDPGMMDAFRSHCRQKYAGEFELLFGVASRDDPAAAAVEGLQAEFPEQTIRLIECPQQLGTNGKVSTLVQLAVHAQHDFLLINDSDVTVSPRYLERVMCCFASPPFPHKEAERMGQRAPRDVGKPRPPVGLVTALYRGRTHGTLPSRLEALGIASEFIPGVLLSKLIEGGLHYGLGSTLAVRREALEKAGGLMPLVDYLADDYELGARVAKAGYRVEVSAEVVETSVPAYGWRGFLDHQLRWLRTVRCSRPWGYVGLIVTHGLGWALVNVLASGFSLVSLWLLGLSFFLRLAQAMAVGAAVLGDHDVLANLWLLPVRDAIAMGLWVASFAGETVVWRGERFTLRQGKLHKISNENN